MRCGGCHFFKICGPDNLACNAHAAPKSRDWGTLFGSHDAQFIDAWSLHPSGAGTEQALVNDVASNGTCRTADEMSLRVVDYFKSIVTPQTSADTALRADLGLVDVTPAQITYVTHTATCTKAARAMNKLAQVPQPRYDVYVVRVGTSYGVVEPTWRSGEWTPAILFTSTWKLRRMLLAF